MPTDLDLAFEDFAEKFGGDVTVASPTALDFAHPKPAISKYTGDDQALDDLKIIHEEVDLSKGWMKFHKLELVKSSDQVRELVDRALRVGRVALDTETQGLDTRIEYRDDGTPYTRHSILGYCLGLEGEGYYIPVRHDSGEKYDDVNVNVDSVERTEAEITRLCLAAQPVLREGMRDVLGAKECDFAVPPRVVIEFWHAKFDQEMLYPVTGIDIWNPYSFDDGMLMVYVLCTEDEQGLKENAKRWLPPRTDPETGQEHRYEMIEFAQLFPKGMKKAERKLQTLIPRAEGEGHNVVLYGCSDGICTNLLCGLLRPKVREKSNFQSFYVLEKQTAQVVRIMERPRVLINKGELGSLLEEAQEELQACEDRIRKQAIAVGFPSDFNPASSSQLADFLFGPKGIWSGAKPEKTGEGQYKTDEKTIEILAKDPAAPEAFNLIIKHRQINKVKGTYLKNLVSNTDLLDQLRLNFKSTGAATGRFTGPKGDPAQGYAGIPIQGIPARDDPKKPKVAHSLRRMFIARPKYVMVKVDYASQELRIAASASGERKWIAEYEREAQTGEPADLHYLTAQAFYPGLTKDSPDYKIKRNGGKCVHRDTLVLTAQGLRTIGLLGVFGKPDTFTDAPEGLTVDGLPVASLYNGGLKDLVHVVARRGAVTCTPEHRFKLNDGQLIRAGDLQTGMVLEVFIADGVLPIIDHWRNIASVGAFLAKHHYYNGAPAQISEVEGGMVHVEMWDRQSPNEVLAVLPAGHKQCFDISMATKEHLYRANCLLTHNTANFALIYGGGVGAVQRATGCDKVEGARLKQAFDASVPQFSKWVKGQHALVKKNGGVLTAFGRFLAIPDANITRDEVLRRFRAADEKKKLGKEKAADVKYAESVVSKEIQKKRASAERKATNFPIQGCIRSVSLVQTYLGQRQIGELARMGDPVDVWTGSHWALATVHDMGLCELAEIDLKDGTLIECDTRHKLLVVSDEGYKWTEFADLQPGMAIATPLHGPLEFGSPDSLPEVERRKGSRGRFIAPSRESELWYWVGRYIGDGVLDPRGGITFCFGDHERVAIERCKVFWIEAGLNPVEEVATHQPCTKVSTRFQVHIWSVDLYDWLIELGLREGVTAHTKLCPLRIFEETLEHRKAFLRGVMDSDGHKPALPTKIDGVWDPKRKGNPYAVHLCQRPVLVDLKRLLRTVGVESIIRGPYRSGTDCNGDDTTSYRLDIQRRMFESNVMGVKTTRLPQFHDMYAPRFLVNELLQTGPFPKSAFKGSESAYTLYLRLKAGGRVTVYTLRFLCELLGVKTSVPIYGFKRLLRKRALGRKENTYTLNVRDPLHRFESDGVITKNSGADILKISLVLLQREFHLRGWLRNGGDDSVRIIMTIHDEIVFEVREERVAEAVPIIIRIMESPYKLVKWKVPLVAEAEIGPSWAANLKWSALLKGKAARPPYLEGVEINPDPEVLVLGQQAAPTPKLLPVAPLPVEVAPPPPPQLAAVEKVRPPEAPPSLPVHVNGNNGSSSSKDSASGKIASIKLNTIYIDRATVCAVAGACAAAKIEAIKLNELDKEMVVEFLMGGEGNILLYSAKEGYRVHVKELEINLRRLNLLASSVIRDA